MNGFLAEYEAICRKYGVVVEACGCCGSPFPIGATGSEIAENVAHLKSEWKEMVGEDDEPR